jgi:hypothetical protein
MFVKAANPGKGGNAGSCSGLVDYLEKENKELAPGQQPEMWFNAGRQDITPQEVINHIDNNKKGLSATASKFFEVDICPSSKELQHLEKITGGQPEKMKAALKDYVSNQVMEEYAKAAGKRGRVEDPRELSGKDLTWYGKVEKNRYYKFNDPEVRGGQAKKGDIRQGHHMHVQVIVSAKTADQQLAISPHSTELAGSIGKIKNNQVYKGFSRNQFKEGSEKAFDEKMGYTREISDSFAYHKTMKTGTLPEKETMQQSAAQERRQQAGAEQVKAEQPEQTPVTGFERLAMPEIKPLKTEFEKAPAPQQKNEQSEQNEREQNREQQRRRGPRL